ncbi:MAG: hypothetical protein AAGC71_06680, partial [Pseudomonadota bacterium]
MLRILTKLIGRVILGTLILGLVAYATLFVANLRDQSPTPKIAEIVALQEHGLPVIRNDNAYLYMLGFAAPPNDEPMARGRERFTWMQAAAPVFRSADDPLNDDYNVRSTRSDAVAKLANACAQSPRECIRLLQTNEDISAQWLSNERWLRERYRTLLSLPFFKEGLTAELYTPTPSYGLILDAQRLHLVDAWRAAADADADAVTAALERDLVYWRLVLTNSDALITKLIATAAIIRHFTFGNLALRRLPPDAQANAIPSAWRTPISAAERSMRRVSANEAAYFVNVVTDTTMRDQNPITVW